MRRNGYERTNQKSLCLRTEDVGVAAAGGVHRRLPSGVVRHGGEGQQLHRQRAGGGGEHPLRHLPSLGEAPLTLGTDGVPYLLLETFCIAFLGTIVGAVISLPLSFLSASNLVPRGVALVGRVLIAAIRTIPAFVYGLMFIRVTGPGPFAGLLTMSLCSIGMVSKMFIESIEDLDKRILESLDAAGCTTFQKIRYGILPQLTADFTSTIIYRFDMNLRDATVLGLVGAGGIGAPLIFAMSSYRWNEVGAILLGLIVLVLIIEWISAKIRVKLARG